MALTKEDLLQKTKQAIHAKIMHNSDLEGMMPSAYQRIYNNQRKRKFFGQNIHDIEQEESVLQRLQRRQEKQELFEKIKANMDQ